MVWISNGIWNPESEQISAIWSKTIWNPDKKNLDFELSGFQMVGAIAMAIAKAQPFQIPTVLKMCNNKNHTWTLLTSYCFSGDEAKF